jgi:glutathione S-transferase
MTASAVQLWLLPRAFGLPNSSPFGIKMEAWLRLATVPYEAHIMAGPPRSRSGKAPYLELTAGRYLSDTTAMIAHLSAQFKVTLDDDLDAAGHASLICIQRLCEDHLYWIAVHDRWIDDAGWKIAKAAYFERLPAPLRLFVPALIRRKVRRDAHGQGLHRLSNDALLARAKADLSTLSQMLGNQEYFLGKKSSADAIALAFLASIYYVPFEGILTEAARPYENLKSYTGRLYHEIFPDYALAQAQ